MHNKNNDLRIRNISSSDIHDIFNWRNHPDIRKNFFNSGPVQWSEHERWFKKKCNDPDTKVYMVYNMENNVGTIRFENSDNDIKVSVMLNHSFIGKGLGSKVIRLGLEKFISESKPGKPIIAEIKEDNIASIKAFEKAGFRGSHAAYVFYPEKKPVYKSG